MAKPANPGGELPAIGSELGAGLTLEEAVTGKLGTHAQDPSPCPEILNTGADAAQASEQPVDQPASLPPPNSWEKVYTDADPQPTWPQPCGLNGCCWAAHGWGSLVKHWANSQKYKGHGLKAACIKKEQPVVHREANKEFAKAKRGRAQQRAAIKTEGQEPCSPRPAASHQPVTPAPRPDPLTPSPRPAKPAAELSPLTPSPQPEPAPAKAKPTAQWGKPLSREAKLVANISLDSPHKLQPQPRHPPPCHHLGPSLTCPPAKGPCKVQPPGGRPYWSK